MESSRNWNKLKASMQDIIKGGQNGVKSQRTTAYYFSNPNYKGGAKWSQVATMH